MANLASEFQDLHQAAQVKYNSYMEAVTALKDVETTGLVAYLLQLKRTSDHDIEDAKVDNAALVETMRRNCDA